MKKMKIDSKLDGSLVTINEINKGGCGLNEDQIAPALNDLVLNMFIISRKFNNIPKEIPTKKLMKILYYKGSAVLFEVGGHFMALNAAADGAIDVYGYNQKWQPIGENGAYFEPVYTDDITIMDEEKNLHKHKKNAVLVWYLMDGKPIYTVILPLLRRLNFIWQSIGATQLLSRAKLLFLASQNSKNTTQKELERLFGGASPISVITDRNMPDSFEHIETGVNASDLPILWDDFDRTFSLLLTFFGFNSNSEPSKRARLNIAEVESNNDIVYTMREATTDLLADAIEEAKELWPEAFGNASVDYYNPADEIAQYTQDNNDIEINNEGAD